MKAPTADFEIKPEHQGLAGFALVFLLLRAFSSGCAALTGVEAISNGVPGLPQAQAQERRDHARPHGRPGRHHVLRHHRPGHGHRRQDGREPGHDLLHNGVPVGAGYVQNPVISQVAAAVFGNGSFLFVVLAAATALVLFLAANTAYNGFPLLGSILAQDRYLPRQLHTRGDRLAFSNGIVLLAGAAILLVVDLRRRLDPADPALHRRRLRLLHAQPDRHGPALEPPPARPRRTRPSAAA